MFNKFFKLDKDKIHRIDALKAARLKGFKEIKISNLNTKDIILEKEGKDVLSIYTDTLKFMSIMLFDLKINDKGLYIHNLAGKNSDINVVFLPREAPLAIYNPKIIPWPVLYDLSRFFKLVSSENVSIIDFYVEDIDFLKTSVIINRLYNEYLY